MKKILISLLCAFFLIGCVPIENTETGSYKSAGSSFEYQVASKLLGEHSFDENSFFLLTCTVKNRLSAGWNESKVLDAYYGLSREPTNEQIVFATSVLHEGNCPEVYFAFSNRDMIVNNINPSIEPIAEFGGIRYYSREQYKDLFTINLPLDNSDK